MDNLGILIIQEEYPGYPSIHVIQKRSLQLSILGILII